MAVVRHPEAREDLDAIVDYIARHNPRAAVRFIDAVADTAAFIDRMPKIGEAYPVPSQRFAGVRRTSVKRFRKYVLYYREIEGGIEILRILHGARDADAIFGER
jgi:toxin ParE1/3/4